MAPMNSKIFGWPSFSPFSTPNLQWHPKEKLCPSKNWTTFILEDFGVFRWNLENAAKVPEGVQGQGGLTGVLTKGRPQVVVDLIKRVISDCRRGFWGDGLGWPWFDQSSAGLTQLIQSLALMTQIKNVGVIVSGQSSAIESTPYTSDVKQGMSMCQLKF
jgi:hypothetical protein